MGVGGSDIILNQEPAVGAGRHGIEAGMVEFEGASLVEPLHETFHRRPVFGLQTEYVGAAHDLLGARRGKPVERLVQVHYQPVQTVGTVLRHPGQSGDMRDFDFIGGLQQTRGADRGEPRCHRFALGRFARTHRTDHRRRVVDDFLDQSGEIGRGHSAPAGEMGAADQGCERGGGYSGGAAFDLQIGCRAKRLLRALDSRLQRAHANLDAVVGCEPLRHQRWQQDVSLSELLDNLEFHDLPTKERVQAYSLLWRRAHCARSFMKMSYRAAGCRLALARHKACTALV